MTSIIIEGHLKSSQAKSWCHENLGKDWWTYEEVRISLIGMTITSIGHQMNGVWSWQVGKDLTTEFQFKNEQDAVLFALRWS